MWVQVCDALHTQGFYFVPKSFCDLHDLIKLLKLFFEAAKTKVSRCFPQFMVHIGLFFEEINLFYFNQFIFLNSIFHFLLYFTLFSKYHFLSFLYISKNETRTPNCSVQFSCSVMSDSLGTHEPQHTRPPCPSPTPRIYPNPCPLSRWCRPTISSSVIPFSSCPQSFPASGSFAVSQLFTSGSQNIGVSASTSVLSMNTQDWSPSGWTGWISLKFKRLSRVFSDSTVQKHHFFSAQLSL